MKKIEGGFAIWAHKTTESDIFLAKPDKWFKIWFYIIDQMNYADNSKFKRGENFLSYEQIMRATGAKKDVVYRCIAWLKSVEMVATEKTTRGMVIFVPRYAEYQDIKNYYDDRERDSNQDSRATAARQPGDTINKEIKKLKKKRTIGQSNSPSENNLVPPLPPQGASDEVFVPDLEPLNVLVGQSKNLAVEDVKAPTDYQLVMQPFFEIYKESLDWGGKGKRSNNFDAAKRLIKKYGLEQTILIAKQGLDWSNTVPYASPVVDPYTLEINISKIKRYYETKGNNQKKVFDLDKKL